MHWYIQDYIRRVIKYSQQPFGEAVNSFEPNNNFNSIPELWIDNDTANLNFLLKFDVSGLTGSVISAKLRLFVLAPSFAASVKGGDFYKASNNGWSESTITWNNAPSADPTLIASLGSVTNGTWYEIDVASVVTGNGVYSFRINSTSTDAAHYSSKEGSNPPQFVINITS